MGRSQQTIANVKKSNAMAILMCYYVQQVLIVPNKPVSVSFPKNNTNKLGGGD